MNSSSSHPVFDVLLSGAFVNQLALTISIGALVLYVGRGRLRSSVALQGISFGLVSVLTMQFPVDLAPGFFFDGRSVILSACGLFFGWRAASIAGGMAAAYRIVLGGVAAPVGVLVIIASCVIGSLYHHRYRGQVERLNTLDLWVFGFVVHAVMVGLMFVIRYAYTWEETMEVFQRISLPILATYPLATVVLGRIYLTDAKRERAIAEVARAEARYRTLFQSNPQPMWVFDVETYRFLDVNDAAIARFGYTREEFLSMTIMDICPAEDVPRLREAVSQISEGAMRPGVWRHGTKGGDILLVDVHWYTMDYSGRKAVMVLAIDMTARLKMENALRESEERLRLALAGARQAMFDYDLETNRLIVTSEYARMLGYAPEEFEETVDSWMGRMHPEDRPQVASLFAAGIAGEIEDHRLEYRLRTKSGDWLWVLTLGKTTGYSSDGRPRRAVGTITDVTLLKQTEELLHLQSASLEAAANGIVITDVEGRIVWANQAFYRLTGYTPEESLGKEPGDLLRSGRQDKAFYKHMWDTILAGEVWRGTVVNRRKDGSLYEEELIITPVRNAAGKIANFVAIKQDISEQMRMVRELEISQRRLAHAVEAGGIGLWDWDIPQGIFEFTDEWCRQLGCERLDFAGTIDDWFSRLHPEDSGLANELQALIDNHPADAFTREFRLLHKDGSYRWLLSKIVLHRDAAGRVVEVSGANLDITERKKLEEEYRQAQKLESVGRLAGGIAHDFNNLLSVIGGYTEMALMLAPEDGMLRRDLEHVKHAADRAANLTRQLLAFSRRQVLRPEPVNLSRLVKEAEAMLRRLVGEDILFELDLREIRSCTMADPGQIEQVLMNLAANARDAMPFGGTLTIRTAELQLEREVQIGNTSLAPGNYAVLTVADTGTGMDLHTRQHIFEPFFTTKEQGKGTGLGLATVYGIISQSGGAISVESAPGEGSVFTIYLPQVAAAVEASGGKEPESSPRGSETILLVEDDAALRELTQRILSILGYQVIVADSGQHALELAERHRDQIVVLLTDVVMPGMSGAQLAHQLMALLPDLRVLYMSGYTDDAIVQYGVLSPGTHLINKPFTPAGLGRAIRELLDTPVANVP